MTLPVDANENWGDTLYSMGNASTISGSRNPDSDVERANFCLHQHELNHIQPEFPIIPDIHNNNNHNLLSYDIYNQYSNCNNVHNNNTMGYVPTNNNIDTSTIHSIDSSSIISYQNSHSSPNLLSYFLNPITSVLPSSTLTNYNNTFPCSSNYTCTGIGLHPNVDINPICNHHQHHQTAANIHVPDVITDNENRNVIPTGDIQSLLFSSPSHQSSQQHEQSILPVQVIPTTILPISLHQHDNVTNVTTDSSRRRRRHGKPSSLWNDREQFFLFLKILLRILDRSDTCHDEHHHPTNENDTNHHHHHGNNSSRSNDTSDMNHNNTNDTKLLLRLKSKAIIRECIIRNRGGEQEFQSLITSIVCTLRPNVGEMIWNQSCIEFHRYHKKRCCHQRRPNHTMNKMIPNIKAV